MERSESTLGYCINWHPYTTGAYIFQKKRESCNSTEFGFGKSAKRTNRASLCRTGRDGHCYSTEFWLQKIREMIKQWDRASLCRTGRDWHCNSTEFGFGKSAKWANSQCRFALLFPPRSDPPKWGGPVSHYRPRGCAQLIHLLSLISFCVMQLRRDRTKQTEAQKRKEKKHEKKNISEYWEKKAVQCYGEIIMERRDTVCPVSGGPF